MVTLANIKDLNNIAKQMLDIIVKNDTKNAIVVGLYGNLGAGKTAFVKEIAKIIGIKENISSPTFVILKRYEIKNLKFKNLVHIDAYRLENGKDLESLKWSEIIRNPDNLIFIEWPDRVKKALPKNILKIYFEFVDEETRRIEVLLK